MRSQIEKNKEAAMDKIEEYSEKPFSDSVAEHLNVYRGAYKALCMPPAIKTNPLQSWTATPSLSG